MVSRIIRKGLRIFLPRQSSVVELFQQIALEFQDFTPQTVIKGYCNGFFPMPAGKKIHWYSPEQRAHIPVNDFHVPKNVKRLVRQKKFDIRYDTNFREVIRNCANREETWIDDEIINVFVKLNELGVAKSVEAWLDGELVGGIYGIRIGGYFATESQFHKVRDAGKVAFVSLMDTLKKSGFLLHDVQIISPYIKQFGATDISNDEFRERVSNAMIRNTSWPEHRSIPMTNEFSQTHSTSA